MREILFRGRERTTGEWFEGHYAVAKDYLTERPIHAIFSSDLTLYPHSEFSDFEEVLPETVGQFTGLIDKNGKKIFEGDIVKTEFGRLCIIVWFSSQVHNGWDLDPVRTCENLAFTKPPKAIDLFKKDNLEVIGNIHDNPELLKEK